jgi:hypothetical protein
MPALDAHQRIGFELECADVTLNMLKQSCEDHGLEDGDTYGIVLMKTRELDTATARPRMQVVLEERKGLEDPKVEFITAPWQHTDEVLRRLKRYVNTVLDLVGNGTGLADWATEASRVEYKPNMRFHWEVPGDEDTQAIAHLLLRRIRERRHARLPQCNVDLYLSQWFRAPLLLKSMMDRQRQRLYDAARDVATRARIHVLANGDDELGGLLSLALYSSVCDALYTPDGDLAQDNALMKDRIQPLPKVGPADLARLALTQAQRTRLATVVGHFVNGTLQGTDWLRRLSQGCSVSNQRLPDLERAVVNDLRAWFVTPQERYQQGTIEERAAHSLAKHQTRNHLRGEYGWDTLNAANTAVVRPGSSVWWGGQGNSGSPGTPTGKPVLPQLLNGRPCMVIEARQSHSPFSKKYWGDVQG